MLSVKEAFTDMLNWLEFFDSREFDEEDSPIGPMVLYKLTKAEAQELSLDIQRFYEVERREFK